MNALLPDSFVRITGVKVKVVVYDICPLREDYSLAPIVMSVLRDLARDTDIIIDFCDDLLNEVTLTEKRIEDALEKSDADLLVFGSYVATRSVLQPMIHMVCTYGRPMTQSSDLPEGIDLNQAILEADPILQLPRHTLIRNVVAVDEVENLSFQNALAEEIFSMAQMIQALKLYKTEKFEETAQLIDAILSRVGAPEKWPSYWVPFSYLHMLGGLAYLRQGSTQAAIYTLSNALARSTSAKMRVQRCAEQIIGSLLQAQQQEQEQAQPAAAVEQPAAA